MSLPMGTLLRGFAHGSRARAAGRWWYQFGPRLADSGRMVDFAVLFLMRHSTRMLHVAVPLLQLEMCGPFNPVWDGLVRSMEHAALQATGNTYSLNDQCFCAALPHEAATSRVNYDRGFALI